MPKIDEHLSVEEFFLIQNTSDEVCISITVPLSEHTPTGKEHRIVLQKILVAVREYVIKNYGEQIANTLLLSLEELIESVNTGIHAKGIGLFVSRQVKKAVLFFFPVRENVTISNTFEIRDILYQQYYSSPYVVLHLTEKEVRLFNGILAALTEVHDDKFPFKHADDYEYNRPSRGSSYVGEAFVKEFEQDKSRMEQIRYAQFLKEVDKTLSDYLAPETKLVVCGVESDVSSFKKHTRHSSSIIGTVKGNYTHMPIHELALAAWNAVKEFKDRQKDKTIAELEEFGKGRLITGLDIAWKAAMEGRAYQLFIEKDYVHPGFLNHDDDVHLHLIPPAILHRILPDATDDLMQMVLNKNGEVIIVENSKLSPYQRMVLITRY